jgi:signal transduction histidine kinase
MPQEAASYTFTFLIVGIVVILFFVIFFYLFIIQLHRRRILHQKEVVGLTLQYEQTLLQSQLEIQEQTFKNISQEIHDNIGQVLSLAKLNLNTIPAGENAEKIALTEELLGKAISDLRDLSKSLNSEKITDIGICEAIRQELAMIEKASSQIKTTFFCDDEDIPLSPEKTIITFRMMQEVMNNIIKHAKATEITVDVAKQEEGLQIKIKDNGTGFNPESLDNAKTGIGLKSIRQRCKLINAGCAITSSPGNGTSVEIAIKNSYNQPL